jgi:cob(I)alamin adenosyltransferase
MKIYTKTGDKGKTHLVGGDCVDKSNPRVDCYGNIDELNCFIGLATTCLENESLISSQEKTTLHSELIRIQHELFNLGSIIACETAEIKARLPKLTPEQIKDLENSIDRMTAALPELTNFILPGGSILASHLHVARSVCRRAERSLVGLIQLLQPSASTANDFQTELIYLNRLSDYLFTCARFANSLLSKKDRIWEK